MAGDEEDEGDTAAPAKTRSLRTMTLATLLKVEKIVWRSERVLGPWSSGGREGRGRRWSGGLTETRAWSGIWGYDGMDDGEEGAEEVIGHLGAILLELGIELLLWKKGEAGLGRKIDREVKKSGGGVRGFDGEGEDMETGDREEEAAGRGSAGGWWRIGKEGGVEDITVTPGAEQREGGREKARKGGREGRRGWGVVDCKPWGG